MMSKLERLLFASLLLAAVLPMEVSARETTTVLLHHDFARSSMGWVTPGYWTGKTAHTAAGTMLLTPASRNGSPVGGRSYTQSGIMDCRGRRLELACRVRGRGKARLGAYLAVLSGKASKWEYAAPVMLTGEWQTITFPMDFTGRGIHTFWPILELLSDGSLEYDDVTVCEIAATGRTKIQGADVIWRHVDGAPFPDVHFQASEPNADFAVFAGAADIVEAPVTLKSDGAGLLTVPGALIQRRADHQALVTVARNGVSCRTQIELIPPAQYQALEEAAKAIHLAKPTSIAVFADSLWDFDRSWNAADEVAFWLDKHNPGKVAMHNFAVRGNSIVTDELRFYQQPTAFHWNANRAMFQVGFHPDIVLVQLGHNDTRAFSGEDFAHPWVSPEEQERSFRRMLVHWRRLWPGCRIILVTPVANDTGYNAKKSAAEVARKQPSYRYGDVDKVRTYIEKLRQLAEEFQVELLDVYSPMAKIPDRIKFFRPDGVHLVRAGYWYLAEQILAYLGTHPVAPAHTPLPPPAPYRAHFVLKDLALPTANMTSPGLLPSTDGKRLLLGFGKLSKTQDGCLILDGKTTGLGLDDSVTFQPGAGATLCMTVRNTALVNPQHKMMFASYFFKADQFLFCRTDHSLYFNVRQNGKWGTGLVAEKVFHEEFGKESFHHVAATIQHHAEEDSLEVRLYLDGQRVAQKRYPGLTIPESRFPLEIGSASYLGEAWRSKAEVREVEIIDRALADDEIRQSAARQLCR